MEQHFINSNYNKSALLWFVLEKKMHHRNNNTATVVHMLHTDHGVKYSLFKSPDGRNIYLKHFCFFVFFLCEQQWQKQKDIFIFNNKKYATAHTCMSKCCVYWTLHTDHGVKCSLLKPLTDVRFIWDTAFLFYFFMWTATTQAERYICFKFLKKVCHRKHVHAQILCLQNKTLCTLFYCCLWAVCVFVFCSRWGRCYAAESPPVKSSDDIMDKKDRLYIRPVFADIVEPLTTF